MSASTNGVNGTNHSPGVNRARRMDGWTTLFGNNPYSPISPPAQGDNRLYSNMTRLWHSQLPDTDYYNLYVKNGVATTIVDRPADDCFARGFEIDGDDDDLMEDEMDRLSVSSTFADAVRWARLFGASVILMVAKDGGKLTDPLNLDNLDVIEDLIVYDNRHIKPTNQLYTDPKDIKYGKPEIFRINPPGANTFEVHETRLIPFSGDPMPQSNNNKTNVWWIGKSALDCCINSITRLERGLNWAERLLERKQQGIYKMEGLGDMFANDLDHLVQKRIGLVDHVRCILSSVVVDATDDYTIENLGLDNVANVIMEFEVAVCADSQLPSVILFGKSASSLNSTGAGELENYYGLVGRIQTRVVAPALERLVSVLWMQGALKAKIPDDWSVEFEPLWVPPPKEQAEVKQLEAQAQSTEVTMLITLMDAGILMPEEIRKIIINRYSEYDFSETADLSSGGDEGYASDVGGGSDAGAGNGA